MDLEAIRTKSVEELTDEERTWIKEHWEELTEADKEKFASVREEKAEQTQSPETVSSG